MVEDKNIPLNKPYIYTLVLLGIAGVLVTIAMSVNMGAGFTIFGLIGTLVATGACGLMNLLYFLRSESLFVRLITPGVSIVLLVLILFHKSPSDLVFFLFFGVVNLILGVFWYVSIIKMKKEA